MREPQAQYHWILMPRPPHSTPKFRLAALSLTATAGLLVTAYLGVLEWKQASVCREFRSVFLAAEDLWFILPWIVMLICLCATKRWPKFGVAFYASFVLSLAVVLIEIDELIISWIQSRGLWMPESLFCDRWNWFDFTLGIALLTGFITAPFAGVLGLATAIGAAWRYLAISRRYRD